MFSRRGATNMEKAVVVLLITFFFGVPAVSVPRVVVQEFGRAGAVSPQGQTVWITGNNLKLKTRVYANTHLTANPVLLIILHGDSPFRPPSYQYEFARKAVELISDVIAVAILRPGYTDAEGDRSEGERGLTTGDNYTAHVVDAIWQTVEQLKSRFHPRETVLVGHSGGAAIIGDVLGREPKSVNAALMVSCPCELKQWREHMFRLQGKDSWKQPVESLSPFDLAGKVNPSVRVVALVGEQDPVVPPEFTEKYVAELKKHGVPATARVLPGLKHDILLEPPVLQELKTVVEGLKSCMPFPNQGMQQKCRPLSRRS